MVVLGIQLEGSQLRLAVGARGVVFHPEPQGHVTEVELQVRALAATAHQGLAVRQGGAEGLEIVLLDAESRGSGVDDASAAVVAGIHSEVSQADTLDRHLPEPIVRMKHREPLQVLCHPGRVVATEEDLSGLCPEGQAELWKHRGVRLHESLEEDTSGSRGKACHAQPEHAIIWHGFKELVVHLDCSHDIEVGADLVAELCAQADVVVHQDGLGCTLTEVGLRKLHSHRVSHGLARHQTLLLPHGLAVGVDIHGGAGKEGRVVLVLVAGLACAGRVWNEQVARGGVEEHLELLWPGLTQGQPSHIEVGAVQAFDTLQAHDQRFCAKLWLRRRCAGTEDGAGEVGEHCGHECKEERCKPGNLRLGSAHEFRKNRQSSDTSNGSNGIV